MNWSTRLAVLVLLMGSALAQSAAPLKLVLSQALVQTTTEQGKGTERLIPEPKQVLPGAVLEHVVSVTNTSSSVLTQVAVNLPVPAGTHYLNALPVLGGVQTLFSADHGKTYAAAPLKKTVTVTENGQAVLKQVEVPASAYTNVRWVVATLGTATPLKLGFRLMVD